MYDFFKTIFIMFLFLFLFIFCLLFIGCKSTEILSDNGERTQQYRELQSDIRDGETKLAVTSERIKTDSEEIGEGLDRLEQSITDSTGNEQELGELIQQIRARELTKEQLIELGIISKE